MTIKPIIQQDLPKISELINKKFSYMKTQSLFSDYILKHPKAFNLVLKEMIGENHGFGAFSSNGQLLDYLIGYGNIPQLKGKEKGIYIPIWGYYGLRNDFFIFERLYQEASKEWTTKGMLNQIISYLPWQKSLENFLYHLGFGLLVIDAILIKELTDYGALPSQLSISRLDSTASSNYSHLEHLLTSHLASSPTFLYSDQTEEEILVEEYFSDKIATFVIEEKKKVVGAIRGTLNTCNTQIFNTTNTMAINYVYINPSYRGLNLGKILIGKIIEWAKINGFTQFTVDFESANLVAKKFWLKTFSPYCYSAIRKIDSRFLD